MLKLHSLPINFKGEPEFISFEDADKLVRINVRDGLKKGSPYLEYISLLFRHKRLFHLCGSYFSVATGTVTEKSKIVPHSYDRGYEIVYLGEYTTQDWLAFYPQDLIYLAELEKSASAEEASAEEASAEPKQEDTCTWDYGRCKKKANCEHADACSEAS